MRNHKEIESYVLELWEKERIYHELKEKTKKSKKKFVFIDGPPYATGQIHPGTAWNKCIKDCVLRYHWLNGYKCTARPGYDTHGLPIEVKVEQKLELKNKKEIEEKIGVERFVDECKAYASQYMGIMSDQFKRLGVWMDWDNPYITYKNEYIESTWTALKEVWNKKLIYEDLYVLAHCPRCETTVANYELEYDEHTSPSIYVKFKVKNKTNEYLIIWTTTPWTLIANMAIMANPLVEYVKVYAKEYDEYWIIAKSLLDNISKITKTNLTVVEQFHGKALDKLEYEHPLQDFIGKEYERKVVMSDEYVSTQEGTGLVHTAPGHGPEDYMIGKRYNIEIYCPVEENGKYDITAKKYANMYVFDANDIIINDLKAKGVLLYKTKYVHRYPHCWRCKTPLIFISSKQWFINISEIKEKMLEQIDNVNWYPDFAKTRFYDFVKDAPDWCISRQRYWGIPLPIWKCVNPECNNITFIGSKKELGNYHTINDLHRPFIDEVVLKCKKCRNDMVRVKDILDVWFDSGNAVWAGNYNYEEQENKQLKQCDFIVEGKDQTRGWFYSLLGMGVAYNGIAPYKNVLMHGFFVDAKGEKMSKSLGNYVPLDEIIEKYGADSFRLWSLKSTTWDDLKFSWDEMDDSSRALEIIYNIGMYLQKNYILKHYINNLNELKEDELKNEDKWLISKFNSLIKNVETYFSRYETFKAAVEITNFLVEDLSRTYLKVVRERIESKNEIALNVFFYVYLNSLVLLHPFTPFITEYVYQQVFRKIIKQKSIALLDYPKYNQIYVNYELEKKFEIALEIKSAILNLRNRLGINVRQPMAEAIFVSFSSQVISSLNDTESIITNLANVKHIKMVVELDDNLEISLKPKANQFGLHFKEKTSNAVNEIMQVLDHKDKKNQFLREMIVNGFYQFNDVKLNIDFFEHSVKYPGYEGLITKFGIVLLKKEIPEELQKEGMIREMIRRIQEMRKQLKLNEKDKIKFYFNELQGQIPNKEIKEIEKAVNGTFDNHIFNKPNVYKKEWNIKDINVVIMIEVLPK
ncbi:MAG: isoleucine--tRNA ligase [Candidatus Micrarchaeota archaeon]|nr:isoleucine--tRNA ligase [Candidatus Micrarchaeota archaeon]